MGKNDWKSSIMMCCIGNKHKDGDRDRILCKRHEKEIERLLCEFFYKCKTD